MWSFVFLNSDFKSLNGQNLLLIDICSRFFACKYSRWRLLDFYDPRCGVILFSSSTLSNYFFRTTNNSRYKANSLSWNGTSIETGAFPGRDGGGKVCLRFSVRNTFCPCGLPHFQLRYRFNSGALPCTEHFFSRKNSDYIKWRFLCHTLFMLSYTVYINGWSSRTKIIIMRVSNTNIHQS